MAITRISFIVFAIGVIGCNNPTPGISEKTIEHGTAEYSEESERIMEVIKEEFKAYFIKDYEEWQSKYVHKEYLKFWGYWDGYPEKIRLYNSWEELDTDKKKRMAGEIKAYWDENEVKMDIRDLNVQIRDVLAWVTFRSISTDHKTGEFLGESMETRILEKVEGEWKIAYGNYLYLPMPK